MSTNVFTSPVPAKYALLEHDGSSSGLMPVLGEREPVLLGESPAVRRLRSQVERIAPYYRTALVRGEAGAGKQLVARAIHAHSPCAEGPFLVANASELAEAVAPEAATSSRGRRVTALLEEVQGGTLYLEGVGELAFPLQAGLLRFVLSCDDRYAAPGRVRPADVRRTDARADMRILAASSRDLRMLSAIGQFRQDLYAWLSVVEIFVPPLRQRIEDIAVLSEWLLRRMADGSEQGGKFLSEASLMQLKERLWPDNLRELEQLVVHAAALAEGECIEPRHLLAQAGPVSAEPTPTAHRPERLQEVIEQHVMEVLTRCGGNKLRAAERLGISRSTLYRMLDAASASGGCGE